MDLDAKLVGQAVAQWRRAHGRWLSQSELARVSGVSGAHISRIERGERLATPKVLNRFSQALQEIPDRLLMLTGYLDAEGRWVMDVPPVEPSTPRSAIRLMADALKRAGWAPEVRQALVALAKATRPVEIAGP